MTKIPKNITSAISSRMPALPLSPRRRPRWPRPTCQSARCADQMAHADLCRPGARRARHQAVDRRLQQGRQRRDGDRALHRRPARAAGRTVPRRAAGTIDAAQSDDDSMASPVDVKMFGAYFPFASRYSLDVPALWQWYGLKEIWEEAYGEVPGVTWLSTGAWDPCNFGTTKPIRQPRRPQGPARLHLPDRRPVPAQFGVVPVTLPYEDVPVDADRRTRRRCWCGITEMYTVGWADVLKYYLTNNISGAWAAPTSSTPTSGTRCRSICRSCSSCAIDSSHYYRQHWYWGARRTTAPPAASSS
jgi:hypothetical protein